MGGVDNTSGLATAFMYLDAYALNNTTRQFREMLIAESGTLSNLQVTLSAAPGAGTSRIFTVMLNGVAQTLAVTIAGTDTTGSDTSNTVAVTAGDKIVLRSTRTGVPAAGTARYASEYSCTVAQRAVWGSSNDATPAFAGTRYGNLGDTAQDNFSAGTEAVKAIPWGLPATIVSLYVELGTAPSAGDSREFTIMHNGAAVGSTVTIAETAITGNATGMSIVIARADTLSLRQTEVNAPANSYVQYGIAYQPTNDGEWNISGKYPADYTDGVFAGLNGAATVASTEAARLILADSAGTTFRWVLDNFYVSTTTAPGGAETRTYTVRENGASTGLTVTLTGAATSGETTGALLMDTDDYLSMLLNKSAAAAASTEHKWTFSVKDNRPPGKPPGGGPPGPGPGPGKPPGPGQDKKTPRHGMSVGAVGWLETWLIWWPTNVLSTLLDAGLKGRGTVDLPQRLFQRRGQVPWLPGIFPERAAGVRFFDPPGRRRVVIDSNPSDSPGIDSNPSDAPQIDTNPSDSPSVGGI